jgi:hypothetical protein
VGACQPDPRYRAVVARPGAVDDETADDEAAQNAGGNFASIVGTVIGAIRIRGIIGTISSVGPPFSGVGGDSRSQEHQRSREHCNQPVKGHCEPPVTVTD